MSYKQAKEAFVSNNLGTSVHTVNIVSAVGLASYALHSAVSHRLPPSPVVDYVLTVLPLLVGVTVAAAQPYLFVGFLVASVLLVGKRPPGVPRTEEEIARLRKLRQEDMRQDSEAETAVREGGSSGPEPRAPAQPYLTVYRAHMMVITVLSILAVDFPVFPREFGKTELWGTSLMDIGVGSFVFALGIISVRPFLAPPDSSSRVQLGPNLLKSIKKSVPTLLLGLVRVIMVKGVEYPEHVTEYGVHWNFFFTLGLVPPFGYLLYGLTKHVSFGAMGVLLTFAHQLVLAVGGLQQWTLEAERTSLISANKEGLTSFPGYLAIYLLGLYIGEFLLPPTPSFVGLSRRPTNATRSKPGMCVPVLLGFAAVFWTWLALCRGVVGLEVSRRLANLPYVLWTAAFNTSFLLGYLLIQLAFASNLSASTPSTNTTAVRIGLPPLLHAANKNALLVFLSANLLTGLVNVCIDTMHADRGRAVGVLVVYSAALYGLAWALRGRKVL